MSLEALHQLLIGQPLIVLFSVIALGMALGNITIKGISLGSSGVLFIALLAGHLGYHIPAGIGTLGLVLFVYCVGIGAGARFFSSALREGATLAKLAIIVVCIGGVVTWTGSKLLDLPDDLAIGIFAGALTSTPALAAATEGLSANASGVSIGYGIAYPFGVIGVVLFVQLLPRLLKIDMNGGSNEEDMDTAPRVRTVFVQINNPNIIGKRIAESAVTRFQSCQVSRILKGETLTPLSYEDNFEKDQILMLVGTSPELELAVDTLGEKVNRPMIRDVENERRLLLVTNRKFAGKSIGSLGTLRNHGVVITRITRLGLTFVPNEHTTIEANDQLTTVGRPDNLREFAKVIGHRESALGTTDLLSLSAGLSLGILLGLIPIGLPGATPISLGLAGGPLLVALILGHLGKVGGIVGYVPRPTRLLLQEIGLVFFLANAGLKGGVSLGETITQYGPMVFLLGIAVTLVPLLVAWPIARKLFKLDPLKTLGGLCGGMTSTPALGAITAKTDSQIPVISYVSAYPIALVVMIIIAKVLIHFLGG